MCDSAHALYIGNEGSAFVEVLVARCTAADDYKVSTLVSVIAGREMYTSLYGEPYMYIFMYMCILHHECVHVHFTS